MQRPAAFGSNDPLLLGATCPPPPALAAGCSVSGLSPLVVFLDPAGKGSGAMLRDTSRRRRRRTQLPMAAAVTVMVATTAAAGMLTAVAGLVGATAGPGTAAGVEVGLSRTCVRTARRSVAHCVGVSGCPCAPGTNPRFQLPAAATLPRLVPPPPHPPQ